MNKIKVDSKTILLFEVLWIANGNINFCVIINFLTELSFSPLINLIIQWNWDILQTNLFCTE